MSGQRLFRLIGALALVSAIAGVAGSATTVAGASPSAPLCSAQHVSGSSSVSSRPGGTTVRLVLTNRYFPSCRWSSAFGYQFLSANGAPIGPPRSHSIAAATTNLYDTFQVVVSVTTMEGVLCKQQAATSIRLITPDGEQAATPLKQTVGVCIGGTTQWTTVSAPAFPRPARCTSASIKVAVGAASGAAGTIYYPLRFTNVGRVACAVSGIPSVQPTTGAQADVARVNVGPPARRLDMSSSGYGNPIRLAPGQRASAAFGVGETANYPPSACVPRNAQSLDIGLAGVGGWWLALKTSVCTKLASTSISGVVPMGSGPYPT
jgi:hypothetical protein